MTKIECERKERECERKEIECERKEREMSIIQSRTHQVAHTDQVHFSRSKFGFINQVVHVV